MNKIKSFKHHSEIFTPSSILSDFTYHPKAETGIWLGTGNSCRECYWCSDHAEIDLVVELRERYGLFHFCSRHYTQLRRRAGGAIRLPGIPTVKLFVHYFGNRLEVTTSLKRTKILLKRIGEHPKYAHER